MVIIDEFDEWFYFWSFRDSLLSHSGGDFKRVTVDSGNESMSKGMAFCSFVEGLEDDCLSASVTTAGDEGDLTGFQDYK